MISTRMRWLALAGLGLALGLTALAPGAERDPAVGTTYRVPYRRTNTNHYLVRVRVNGKGPFNFLVDTGAPALYIGTEAARAIGLEPSPRRYWTDIDRIDFEGGASLTDFKARVEDPFQLVGMNALGLPGASIDGILGFSALARFRIEIDPTSDRMTWTRLDYEPRTPAVPRLRQGDGPPPEVQAMNLLGPMAKLMAVFVGKEPEEQLHPEGRLGLELTEADGAVRVLRVLEGTPAAAAGLRPGDLLVRLGGRDVHSIRDAHEAMAEVRPGDTVALTVRRGPEALDRELAAGEGF